MSDTDALVLIPPDLFLSDTSDTDTFLEAPQNHVRHLTIALQSLQNRLQHLENVSQSESLQTPSEPFSLNNSPTKRLTNLYSTPNRIKTTSYKSNTFPKSKQRYPPSPKTYNGKSKTLQRRLNLPHLAVRDKVSVSDIEILSNTDSTYSADLSNMDSNSNLMDSSDKCSDVIVLDEIDSHFGNVCKYTLPASSNDVRIYSDNFVQSKEIPTDSDAFKYHKYINLTNGNCDKEKPQSVQKIHKLGELKNSVYDRGTGMRDIMYPDRVFTNGFDENSKESISMTPNDDEFKKSIYKTAAPNEVDAIVSSVNDKSAVSLPHKKSCTVNYGSSGSIVCKKYNTEDAVHLPNQSTSVCSERLLPSLSKLWDDSKGYDGKVYSEKFEEEKLRRQHCEKVIQELQSKLLEQQQKLAVAVQVDSAKDEAIYKLKSATSTILHKHEQEISVLQTQLNECLIFNTELKKKMNENEDEIVKYKTQSHECEDELRRAIDDFEKEKNTLNREIDEYKCTVIKKETSLTELKESSELIIRLNRQLSDTLNLSQDNLEKIKLEDQQIREQLIVLQKSHTSIENELCIIQSDKTDLLTKIAEEENRNSHLDDQRNKLQTTLDVANEKIRTLENEFESFKTASESQKSEMKTHYQKQMETIVKNKLNEFQKQLESAVNLMANEIHTKEKDIALQSAKHLQKMEDTLQLEVNILEEKHKEEIKFHQVQLTKSKQAIQRLQEKLTSYRCKLGEIVPQLHSMHQNQWQQTLKILTNDSANVSHIPTEAKCFLNGYKYQNGNGRHFDKMQQSVDIQNDNDSNAIKATPKYSKNNEPELKLTEEKLEHYVKLLLQKAPGIPDLPDGKETSEQSKAIDSDKPKSLNIYSNKNLTDFEYPTSDRNTERKTDKNSRTKAPWK